MSLNIFEVIDFRMLSALIGEVLVTDLADHDARFQKNPNIDGYPDLLNVSRAKYRQDVDRWRATQLSAFIKYPHGGIEIKNTFGTKKGGTEVPPGGVRVGKINAKLDWKAHHRYTNNLLALFSDYVDRCPQISAVMFCACLEESDWKEKQNPKGGSTMTSFCVTETSGWTKVRSGMKICRDEARYLSFFGL